MEESSSRQRVYELLGAPSLVYRHAPSYDCHSTTTTPEPWGRSKSIQQEARYIQSTHHAVNRVRSRWYYNVDHPFRSQSQQTEEHHDGPEGSRKRQKSQPADSSNKKHASKTPQKKSNDDDAPDDAETKRRKMIRALNRADPSQEEPFLYYSSSLSSQRLQAARRSVLPNKDLLRIRHLYDQSYVPGVLHSRSTIPYLPNFRCHNSRLMAKERMDADLAYLAPIDIGSIRYALGEEDATTGEGKPTVRWRKMANADASESTNQNPAHYGNCILCVACPCPGCQSIRSGMEGDGVSCDSGSVRSSPLIKQKPSSWCLIHPTGELLSCLCISNLILPHGMRNKATLHSKKKDDRNNSHPKKHELEVGEPILQIAQCGKWESTCSGFGNDEGDTVVTGVFVARSPNYCTVFKIHGLPEAAQVEHDQTKEVTESSVSNSSTNGSVQCSGLCKIEEVTRIDLRSQSRSFPSYRPIDIACHPNYGNAYTDPKFAVLCHSDRDERNVIHHVILSDPPVVTKHTISCLKAISEIDFTNSHPMTLWAAAKSYVRPALARRFAQSRPILGHGHSLFTIDLRTNDAIFQWSPSAEEALPEGVHSISGIRTDWQKDHTVWVSSMSVAKAWEIDGRMTCRPVNTWSLPSACDDWGAVVPRTGLYGAGTLLTKPLLKDNEESREATTSCPLLSVGKNPGSFGFHLYQRPDFAPRLQTQSLECVACRGLTSQTSGRETSICRSSIFALPDVSEKTFTCGIAALRTSISEVLAPESVRQLGYEQDPTDFLCAVTMTNKGDIYGHALVESKMECKGRARNLADLPLGSIVLPVPKSEQRDTIRNSARKEEGSMNMRLFLSDTFPMPSDAILPHAVMTKRDCRSFSTVRLEQLPTYAGAGATHSGEGDRNKNELDGSDSISSGAEAKASVHHPRCEMDLGSVLTIPGQKRLGQEKRHSGVELSRQHVSVARNGLESFGDCFFHDRKSVVEEEEEEEDHQTRSDMTTDILTAADALWNEKNDNDKIQEHIVVKKEDPFETDGTLT